MFQTISQKRKEKKKVEAKQKKKKNKRIKFYENEFIDSWSMTLSCRHGLGKNKIENKILCG